MNKKKEKWKRGDAEKMSGSKKRRHRGKSEGKSTDENEPQKRKWPRKKNIEQMRIDQDPKRLRKKKDGNEGREKNLGRSTDKNGRKYMQEKSCKEKWKKIVKKKEIKRKEKK